MRNKFLIKIKIALILVLFSFYGIHAQHIKIKKKEMQFLTSEKVVNVVFTHDQLTHNGDRVSEEEFVAEKKRRFSKTNRDFDSWFEEYTKSKNTIWPESYVNSLNQHLENYNAPVFKIDIKETNYTMKVHMVWLYSGYDVFVAKIPAKIQLTLEFIDNSNNKVLNRIEISPTTANNKPKETAKWKSLKRSENAFEEAGFKLAITLRRLFKKK